MTKHADYSSFGGGAIEQELFDHIRKILPEGGTILEFGSGYGTDQLLKHYDVISIEHDIKYHKQRPGRHKAYLAELKQGWYDPSVVKAAMQNHFDLVLVDGPPGESRAGLVDNLDLFKDIGCPVIFDDVNRDIDRSAMAAFVQRYGYGCEVIKGEEKNFCYCVPRQVKPRNKVCCYTVITGDYDRLVAPGKVCANVDYICFTDNPELKSDIWDVRLVPVMGTKVKTQRRIKIMAWDYVPEYDISFYVDGNMEIVENLQAFMEFFHGGFMTKRHPHRRNIYEEAEAVIKRGKAKKIEVVNQIQKYRAAGFRVDNLYETGFIIRDNSEQTKRLCQAWWREVEAHTHRDQLSLPVAESMSGVRVVTYGRTLFERFIRIRPHTGKRTPITRVWYSAPADPQKNIGRAYNEFCDLVPDDSDWICLRDQDSLFWPELALKQIEDVLELHGDRYQLLGCVTNRLGTEHQRPFVEDYDDPNVLKAHDRAVWLHKNRYAQVSDHNKPIAGLFMLFQKKTWARHRFAEGTHTADSIFGEAVLNQGGHIGIMNGLYVFHYYRFHEPNARKYIKHLQP